MEGIPGSIKEEKVDGTKRNQRLKWTILIITMKVNKPKLKKTGFFPAR